MHYSSCNSSTIKSASVFPPVGFSSTNVRLCTVNGEVAGWEKIEGCKTRDFPASIDKRPCRCSRKKGQVLVRLMLALEKGRAFGRAKTRGRFFSEVTEAIVRN